MDVTVPMTKRVEAMRAVLSGALTSTAAAAQLGVSAAQFEQWMDTWAMTQELASQQASQLKRLRRRTVNRVAASVAVCMAAVIAALEINPAWAQVACTQTLPSPLKTFCPNAPAIAADVNSNFSTVAGWLTTKTGPLGTQDIATRDINATGSLTVTGNQNFTGSTFYGTSTRQMINLYNAQYGMGVQSSTTYVRTGGGFAVYLNGVHANNQWDSGGGSTLMTVDSVGNMSAAGQLSAASLRQRDCQWTNVGKDEFQDNQFHTVTCGSGRYMAGWQCFAGQYLDGRCGAYCCLP